MALTVISSPDVFSPAYNPVVYYINSTNKEELSFRYVVDIFVYINNVKTKVLRKRVAPRPGDGYLELDISRIVQNYLTFTNPFNFTAGDAVGSYIQYEFDVYESYINSSRATSLQNASGETQINMSGTNPFNIGDSIRVTPTLPTPNIAGLRTTLIVTNKVGNNLIVAQLWNNVNSDYNNYFTQNGGFEAFVSLAASTEEIDLTSKLTVNNKWVFNGAIKWEQFVGTVLAQPSTYFNSSIFTLNGVTKQAISTLPDVFRIRPNQYLQLNWRIDGDTTKEFLYMESFDKNGQSMQVRRKTATNAAWRVSYTWVGWRIADNSSFVSGTSTTTANFMNDVAYYEFWRASSAGAQQSKKYRVYIDRECKYGENYQLLFLDRLGSIGSFYFTDKNTERYNVTRESGKRLMGDITTRIVGAPYYSIKAGESSSTIFNTNEVKSFTLTTSWFNPTENEYFMELMASPVIMLYKDGLPYPQAVDIKTSSWTKKTIIDDEVIQYTLEVELNNNEIINW
jgi:hypothetical protein